MMSTVIGGTMLPHAPQFFTLPEQREALIKLDLPSMVKMRTHPLAPFLTQLQIDRLRPKSAKRPAKEGS